MSSLKIKIEISFYFLAFQKIWICFFFKRFVLPWLINKIKCCVKKKDQDDELLIISCRFLEDMSIIICLGQILEPSPIKGLHRLKGISIVLQTVQCITISQIRWGSINETFFHLNAKRERVAFLSPRNRKCTESWAAWLKKVPLLSITFISMDLFLELCLLENCKDPNIERWARITNGIKAPNRHRDISWKARPKVQRVSMEKNQTVGSLKWFCAKVIFKSPIFHINQLEEFKTNFCCRIRIISSLKRK